MGAADGGRGDHDRADDRVVLPRPALLHRRDRDDGLEGLTETPQRIALDGDDWRICGHLGLDAALRAALAPASDDERRSQLPARVPGSVIDDLWRAGEVPNPYVGRNSLALEWVAQRAWLYRRTFDAPALRKGERVRLLFEGIDHGGSVFLDGEQVAEHDSMFAPLEVDVTDALAAGETHTLAVVLAPAPPSEPELGRTSQVQVHKSRMSYGWDFSPRMVHQGIWRSVSLLVTGSAWIADACARSTIDDGGDAMLMVDVSVEGEPGAGVTLEAVLVDPEGVEVSRGTAAIGSNAAPTLALTVPRPRRWWPNGSGEAPVYRMAVRLLDERGDVLDERSIPHGFRSIDLVPDEGAGADARAMTFVVNGQRIYVNGWNWVPLDPLYGVPRPDRLEHLLRMAHDAHVNLLRVWGGGLIESGAFYDACDRLGILVWQEFSQSSSIGDAAPSTEPAFIELMRREAERIVPLRRNHPSLALWCGGNELSDASGPLDESRSPVLAELREIVTRLDPGRAWLPTSPAPGGEAHGPWEHQGLDRHTSAYDERTSSFDSEFGVEAMGGRRLAEATIPADQRWPATRDNPVYRHLGDWWNNETLVQRAFGGRLDTLDTLRRASRWLGGEALRYAVEANRRRAFRNSGSIPWQLNESYPNAWCTSAIDHRGDPKPSYFGVRRAYRAMHVCARFARQAWSGGGPFEAQIWAWSTEASGALPRRAFARACIVGLDGVEIVRAEWRSPKLPADGAPVECGILREPFWGGWPPLFVVDLVVGDEESGSVVARNRYLLAGGADFSPLLDLTPSRLDVTVEHDPDRWRLRLANSGLGSAIGLMVEDDRPIEMPGWAEADDGSVDLLPGESIEITVRWASAPIERRRLRVDGFGIESIVIADG